MGSFGVFLICFSLLERRGETGYPCQSCFFWGGEEVLSTSENQPKPKSTDEKVWLKHFAWDDSADNWISACWDPVHYCSHKSPCCNHSSNAPSVLKCFLCSLSHLCLWRHLHRGNVAVGGSSCAFSSSEHNQSCVLPPSKQFLDYWSWVCSIWQLAQLLGKIFLC